MRVFSVLSVSLLLYLTINSDPVFCGKTSNSGLVKFIKKVAKSKIVKFLERSATAWAPSDIVTLVVESFEDDPLDEHFGIVNAKLDDIALKLDNLQRQIETSTVNILSEVNFQEIKRIGAIIDSAPSKLATMIPESGGDKNVFSRKLDLFVQSFSFPTNMEYTLVQQLNTGGQSSASLLDRFADVVKNNGNDNFCQLKSSPNAMMFEFHLTIMNWILKLTTILATCQRAQDKIFRRTTTVSPMAAREEQAINKLYRSMKNAANSVSDSQSLSSYINLNNHGGYKPIHFAKVFHKQNFALEWLSGMNLCLAYATCDKFTKVDKPIRGCYGTLRDCVSYPGTCTSCICICDQDQSGRVGKIYGGLIEATEPNSVIIGVRVAIQQGVLFLQIQTGKLLPLGFIDSSTIKWKAPPSDLTRNYFTFGNDDRKFALGDVFMDDHVLTGVKFVMHSYVIRLSVVGKRIVNVNLGQLETHPSGSINPDRDDWRIIPILPDISGRKIGINEANRQFSIDKSVKGDFIYSVKFTVSDDGGGETVPYFDGNNIELTAPKPLCGIGFIHYSNAGYSGYIRPILKTFNYKNLIPI